MIVVIWLHVFWLYCVKGEDDWCLEVIGATKEIVALSLQSCREKKAGNSLSRKPGGVT